MTERLNRAKNVSPPERRNVAPPAYNSMSRRPITGALHMKYKYLAAALFLTVSAPALADPPGAPGD
ncbi:MAG TPA: hypothetical protein VJ998_10910, partial [Pseudomonadales bacterium]|nr:hypothetical protein [Pseudomonadales bacterium]